MKIGRLRHRVTLKPVNFSQDSTGAAVATPPLFESYTVWAEVRTANGYESSRPELNTVISGYTHTVTLRKPIPAIRTTWRVLWDGRTLEVVAIREPDNRGRSVLLDCAEVDV